jgi:hypothetical protein
MAFCLIIEKQVVKIVMNCILLILCSLTQLLIIMEDLTTNGCSHNSSNDVNIITMLIANRTIIFINTKISGSNLENEVLFDNT